MSGHLTQDQYDKLIADQKALEAELRRRNEAHKAKQLDAIKARIAQRKTKRLSDLKEQHERDKNRVRYSTLYSGSYCVIVAIKFRKAGVCNIQL